MACIVFVFCVVAVITAPAQVVTGGSCPYGSTQAEVFPPYNICTLNANPGDVVDVTAATTDPTPDPNFLVYVDIADFNGNEVAAGCGPELNGIVIPDTASTPLTASFGSCFGNGGYYFWVYIQSTNHPSGAVSLPFGQTQSGTISSPAQSNTYTFSANANEVVNFTMTATSGSLSPRIRLYNSAGGQLADAANRNVSTGNCSGGSVIQLNNVALPSTGTYTVLVGDCGNAIGGDANTGNYNIYMQRTETFTSLLSFNGSNGSNPQWGALVQGIDGNFYGTTSGPNLFGCDPPSCTVFKITPGGTLTTLHSFTGGADGTGPMPGLVLATDGDFYGVNSNGGGDGSGVVFKITAGGTLTTLLPFNFGQGANPNSALVQATNGNFYGTTVNGGHQISCCDGGGVIFKMTPAGAYTVLHFFDFTDGWDSVNAQMLQATDGQLYGETAGGGTSSSCSNNCGTVFKITPSGEFTSLHSFNGTDGGGPTGGLVQGRDGNFYGTTHVGGANSDGTVFKITQGGRVTTLHSFNGTDGGGPNGGLVLATDGNFYGTTEAGGANGDGTIFEITPAGTLTTLHNFDGTDGAGANAVMLQATNGTFYGTTYAGGTSGNGTVFSLSTGLGPFVTFLPAAHPVGSVVEILGQGFTGATNVSFNGTAATFTVESDTYLKATVPAGATTGNITVTEPGGTLTSNKIFRVTPQIFSFSPATGSAGTTVVITGNSFTGATEVTFSSQKKASFTVDSDTQITATVPAGAITGVICVWTAGGNADISTVFTVTP